MGYSIDSVRYLGDGRLAVRAGDAKLFLDEHEDDLPEGNFFDALSLKRTTPDDEMLPVETPHWYGNNSGRTYPDLFFKSLATTRGDADLLVVWEGGDSQTGVRVRGGVASEAKVKISLM